MAKILTLSKVTAANFRGYQFPQKQTKILTLVQLL